MASFNQVILLGNLTRDPQLKYLPNQTPVVEFGLATNRKWKTEGGEQREDVCFVDCAAFGKTAETINEYFTKGKPIMVTGRLKYDTWEDKQGGGKRHKLSVVVDHFVFVGVKEDGGGGDRREYAAPPQQNRSSGSGVGFQTPQRQQQGKPAPTPPFGDEEQFKEDDIPF